MILSIALIKADRSLAEGKVVHCILCNDVVHAEAAFCGQATASTKSMEH
jgi:hypothetical protein